MGALQGRRALAGIAAASTLLLTAAVLVGLRLPGSGFLPGFPRLGRLDYSAGPPGGFAPLDSRLVDRVLGSTAGLDPAGSSGSQPTPAATASGPASGALAATGPRDVPAAVTHAFSNDHFADAHRVPALPYTARTDSSSATFQAGEPRSCAALGGRTAWYAFTPTRDIGLLADTFGTQRPAALTVYTGTTLTALRREGDCSSDPRGNALVAFPAAAFTTYYFQVDQAVGGEAVFTLQQQGITTRASVTSGGAEGNGASFMGVISADGRDVAMMSGASLGSDEASEPCSQAPSGAVAPCGRLDLYRRDRERHVTTNQYPAQSVTGAGSAEGSIVLPGSFSEDGRYQVFWASEQVTSSPGTGPSGASPYRFEVFRLDRVTGHVERVSVPCSGCLNDTGGTETDGSSARPEISADGRYVAFISWASNITRDSTRGVRCVFVRDMLRRVTTRVDVPSDRDRAALGPPNDHTSARTKEGTGDQGSDLFSISADGRYVVFKSSSSNLVWHDSNDHSDVFVRDRRTGTTVRVNVSSSGAEANGGTRSVLGVGLHTISADGRFVVFNSDATNLVRPSTRDDVEHVYRRDLRTGVTTLVTLSSTGAAANDGVKRDPTRAAFTYLAPLLFAGGTNVALSGMSYSITPDARFVVFNSDATNLVPDSNNSTDVFLRDLVRGATVRVSVASSGAESDGSCGSPTLSAKARFIAFDCSATNLVDDDSNENNDVFVREIPGARPLTGWF